MKPAMRKLSFVLLAAGAGAALAGRALRQKRRMDFEGASVVITGGSRGLGLELARRFGREGARAFAARLQRASPHHHFGGYQVGGTPASRPGRP